MRAALIALFSLAAYPAASEPILTLPVDCVLGETCHIQQYVDRDAGDGYRDYQCGNLAYDGHKGTDFSLPTLRAMQDGVNVIAAAPGMVRGVRDGMEDQLYTIDNAKDVKGKECGNGVVVRHDDGWETQYCHLKKGSVRVRTGYKVKRGTVLGEIGLSGKTQFPHLHMSVRHNGKVVDPFNTGDVVACDVAGENLWRSVPDYLPGALIEAGFADRVPDYDEIHAGTAKQTQMSPASGALVLYGFAYGGRKGDVIRIEIHGPEGLMANYDSILEKNLARFFRAYGKRLKKSRWPSGEYDGIVTMIRDGQVLSRATTQATIN
ncbi:M23 family metallopeptidase [Tropicibacter sp. Alg240-R139]|uniref:M23 family metallopeptidase n=1 Tax=Tropicibacter sp. Alg240-R139 TaxID=2305991 RepID=UPI0013DE9CB5|nr:M23 family metallopeptidase [Tropicibacter sp. Alg240-R139]